MHPIKELRNFIVEHSKHTEPINELSLRLEGILAKINKMRKSCSSEQEIDKLKKLFVEETQEFAKFSFWGDKARQKSKQNRGDFITQEKIWYGRIGNHGAAADHDSIGTFLSKITYEMSASKANERRVNYLLDVLKEYEGRRVASLAGGSGIEFWQLPSTYFLNTNVFLLDQNEAAIDSAKAHLEERSEHITFKIDDVFRFINRRRQELGSRDLIYLFGLFDHIPTNLVVETIKKLWDSVLPKGEIIFTNVHPDNPSRLWMEWTGDWYLNHKTKEDLFEIPNSLDRVGKVEYFIDDLNVYQYMRIKKRA